jgi:hypothetical protein
MSEEQVISSQSTETLEPDTTTDTAPGAPEQPISPEEPNKEKPQEIPSSEPQKVEEETHDVRRMKRLLREKYEAEAERDALRAMMESQKPVQQEPQMPTRNEFESDEQFIHALTDFKAHKMQQEIEQKVVYNLQRQTFAQKVEEAKKEIPDYDEVLQDSAVQFNPAIRDVIISSPLSAHVAYELAKNNDLAVHISRLPPVLAAREIGKLEVKIENARIRPKSIPVASKAPAPIKPVSTKGSAGPVNPDSLSDREWFLRERKNQMSRNRK